MTELANDHAQVPPPVAKYEYTPLPDPGSNGEQDIHIRLMKLVSDGKAGQIACTITSCPLTKPIKYAAVSYCWGHPKDKVDITCDAKSITVPANLYNFLLRTQAKGTDRYYWIDSICINQDDPVEKTSQVAAMRHIYRQASNTLIWLGMEDEHGTIGLTYAQKLSSDYQVILNPEKQKQKEEEEKKNSKWSRYRAKWIDNLQSAKDPIWAAYFSIFDREWFQRAWVVQEVALSTQPWVLIGSKAIPWIDLMLSVFYVVSTQVWVFEFYGSTHINIVHVMYMSQSEITGGLKMKGFEILARHRQSQSTNPKDHIFAFYGLSAHDDFKLHGIEPNYQQSTESLYKEITASSIREADHLEYLDIPRLTRTNPMNLPSWVQDWSSSDGGTCFSLLFMEMRQSIDAIHLPKYHATLDSKSKPIINATSTHLELRGYTIDRIASLTSPWPLQDVSGYQTTRKQALVLQKNQANIHEWETLIAPFSNDPYPTGENREDVLWQICVAGHFANGKEETKKLYEGFAKRQWWLRYIQKFHLNSFTWVWMLVVLVGQVLRYLGIPNPEIGFRTLTVNLLNRRAARTVEGYCGLVPGIADVGDFIVLCEGARLPLVLREKVGGKKEEFEFIGDCYYHGAMEGEFWDQGKCGKVVLV